MDAQGFYDELGDDYDRMVSWEERLAREERFMRGLFMAHGTRRVLDCACATGMHAVAFALWGLESAAADLSPVMVEHARTNARTAGVSVDLRVAGFGQMAAAFEGKFDAVTCLGNSLPHLRDEASLRACLADFHAVMRPGALLVLQNRNYDRVLKDRQRFMPLTARADPDGEILFLRITDFPPLQSDESIEFTLVTLRRRGGAWSQSAQSTPLRALRRQTMEGALAEAGFSSIETFGGYDGAPFDPATSPDLVIVARA
jgi:glycine/sarcosine N-methyltransferase